MLPPALRVSVRAVFAVVTAAVLCGCSYGAYKLALPNYVSASYEGNYDETIELIQKRVASGKPYTKRVYYHLCDAYLNTKQYDKLFPCVDALETQLRATGPYIWQGGDFEGWEGGRDEGHAPALMRAEADLDLGRYDESLANANAAQAYLTGPDPLKEVNKPNSWRILESTDGLHRVYMVKGLACASKGDTGCTAEMVEALRNYKHPNIWMAGVGDSFDEDKASLAKLLMAQHDWAGAYDVLTKGGGAGALRMLFTLGMGTGMYEHDMLARQFMAGHCLVELGRMDEARKVFDAIMNNPAVLSMGNVTWLMLRDMARIEAAQKRPAEAVGHLAKSIAIIEAQRSTLHTEATKIGFVGDKQAVYRDIITLLVEQGRAAEALEYAERGKSRALVDLLAERQNFAPEGQGGDQTQALTQLASLERKSAVLTAEAKQQGAQLRSAMGTVRAQLRQSAPELASLVSVSASNAEQIRAGLGPDETLLEYFAAGDDLYVFSVTRGGVEVRALDGKGLEMQVRALRRALAAGASDAYRPLARALYDRLIAPAPGALERPRLLIVGHGPLHYLPFAALTDGQKFLVDRVSLEFLPSASVMQFLAARKATSPRGMLVLANPDLGDPSLDLPGAEAEARAIKTAWPEASVLTRKAATKAALVSAGGQFRVVHVAAHGEFVSDQPLASRLLLAPAGGESGQLTAGDLYGMRLPADLVTLSACETGMGKVLSGDDVVGLTRGFLYAGAGNVVASLWPVSDEETKFLMASFYRNLKQLPKAEALRQAQLETKLRYPHPFFWSAFQLTGLGR
jgi:Uncharacterized protein conserved in bacteria